MSTIGRYQKVAELEGVKHEHVWDVISSLCRTE